MTPKLKKMVRLFLPEKLRSYFWPWLHRWRKKRTEKNYANFLGRQSLDREARRKGSPTCRISVLTSIYARTPLDFFQKAMDSLESQTTAPLEVIILAHGEISDELRAYLNELSQRTLFRCFFLPDNLGIIGAMRFCLEKAKGDYIVPFDADDELVTDAFETIAHAVAATSHPDFLYSDEDVIIDGKLCHPFFRPQWDPALNLCESFIWHLSCFSRLRALEVEVYTDKKAEWCHDWDTVFRFYRAKARMVHIPETLYHWRRHSHSSTNQANPEKNSLTSQRHVLKEHLKLMGGEKIAKVDEKVSVFSRVSPLTWKDPNIQASRILKIGRDDSLNFGTGSASGSYQQFADCLKKFKNLPYVLFEGPSVVEPTGMVTALLYFDLLFDVSCVSGTIINDKGRYLDGGRIQFSESQAKFPYFDFGVDRVSPYAFSAKAFCVTYPCPELFIVRRETLDTVLCQDPELSHLIAGGQLATLAIALGIEIRKQGQLVVHTPYGSARRQKNSIKQNLIRTEMILAETDTRWLVHFKGETSLLD